MKKTIWIAGLKEYCNNYVNLLEKCNIDSYVSLTPLPNTPFDGLILPGGGDIEPSLFNQTNQGSDYIDYYVDIAQLKALSLALHLNKPVLGICKGIQIINVYFGGDLIQDLPTSATHQYIEKDQMHITYICKDSYLYNLYGNSMITNSAHHQGIATLGKNLQCIQYSQDGVIEGIVHTTAPVYGVQWHPERMDFDTGCRLIKYIYRSMVT